MRTTIRLDEQLLKRAKRLAANSGESLTSVIEDALRERLARADMPKKRKPLELITFGGNGPAPGVDLDDNASLIDVMDGRN